MHKEVKWSDLLYLTRYLIVVLNGTKNHHQSPVAIDIQDSILKTQATKECPATYWTKEEKWEQLVKTYKKWEQVSEVWLGAAKKASENFNWYWVFKTCSYIPQTHQDQLKHVEKGCLAHSRQDIRTNGSHIEGLHKGWGIMCVMASAFPNVESRITTMHITSSSPHLLAYCLMRW